MSRPILILTLAALSAACAAPRPVGPVAVEAPTRRPLDVLPPGFNPAEVRADVVVTARERYGRVAVDSALASPTYLIAKRFYGMVPPPPPGADADWRAPTPSALMIRDRGRWKVATETGWREAKAVVAAEIDRRISDSSLWSEPPYTPPCPDFGANLLVLKVPGQAETVRQSLCSGSAADLVQAALNA